MNDSTRPAVVLRRTLQAPPHVPSAVTVQPGAARIVEIVPVSTFCDASFEAFWALLDEVGLEAIPLGPTPVHTISSLPSAVAALVGHVRERRAARSTPLVMVSPTASRL